MSDTKSILLEFESELNKLNKSTELRQGLSAVVQIGDTIWVANDETISLERLLRQQDSRADAYQYSGHKQFVLSDYLSLPVPPSSDSAKIEEADIEGLDYRDGYLWLVGSHGLKRKKPDPKDSIEDSFKHLAKVSSDGNRYLLARIPVIEKDGICTLAKEIDQNGKQHMAGQLRGSATGNALTEALAQDKHLQQYLAIPGKDNGFDIEGLAVGDDDRVFLGLRGPMLRGWAVILELQLEANVENSTELKLKSINSNNTHSLTGNPTYRKHFLELGGLGIRDLCCDGADLLILAGPTMDLDGPVRIFRWQGGAQPIGESLVWLGDTLQEEKIEVPDRQGKDHAEGMTLFFSDGWNGRAVLVVYDSQSKARQIGDSTVKVDIFALPVQDTLPMSGGTNGH